MAMALAHQWQTGIAQVSANSVSASNAASEPGPRWETIRGRAAEATAQVVSTVKSGTLPDRAT